MKFIIKATTTRGKEALLGAIGVKINKKKGKYTLIQKSPPILIIENFTLGSWLKLMAKKVGVQPEYITNNPVWQNEVKNKALKSIEKVTEIPRNEFTCEVEV
jgi:hypothetical protein